MVARIALFLVSIPLLAHGGEGLYHAFRSRTQAQVTCAELTRGRPASGWLRVTGCEVDYVRAAYREQRGRITELFFPLRPMGSSPAVPAALVVSTRDPQVLAIAEKTIGSAMRPDEEQFLVMMLQIVTTMRAAREVDGFTRSNLEMLRTRRDLAAIKAPLADGFAVLDLHRRPRILFPAIEAAAGALALLLFTFLMTGRRRRAVREHATPAEAEAVTATTNVAGAPHRAAPGNAAPDLRRLMLLNLPPDAATSAIETAPPLGTQESVRSALARVLPGISFAGSGIAEFNRPDHSIRADLGQHPEVWTIAIDMAGDAAAAALKRLVTQTGWRAYAPKLGRFITTDDLT